MVLMLEVRDEELPVPVVLEDLDLWEFVGGELLVLRGVGIVEGPLAEGDISADKVLLFRGQLE